jgi:hypothetical protein
LSLQIGAAGLLLLQKIKPSAALGLFIWSLLAGMGGLLSPVGQSAPGMVEIKRFKVHHL